MPDNRESPWADDGAVSATLMRGGTSKGVFLRLDTLPTNTRARDALALRLLGSPDPMQIDGLGSTYSSTSKLMAVATSASARRLGYTIDSEVSLAYLFAQVGVDDPVVDWSGNCGNLTSAVVPFAVHEDLVSLADGHQTVLIHNLNTHRDVVIGLDVLAGKPREDGDFQVAGVPGTGSRIDVSFLDPAGSVTGRLFPTGNPMDLIHLDGAELEVSILDVSSPVVAVRARSLGLVGDETPAALNARPDLLARFERIRAEAAVMSGLADDVTTVAKQSPALPRLILVGPRRGGLDSIEAVVRMTSMGKVHHAFPGTGLAAAGVLFSIPGTVADLNGVATGDISLRHPKGTVVVRADIDLAVPNGAGKQQLVRVNSVSVPRTARRLMTGTAHLPRPPW